MTFAENLITFYNEQQTLLAIIAGISVFVFILSLLLLPYLVSLIPTDYFQHAKPYKMYHRFKHPALRVCILIIKNTLGWLLIILGILLLFLPGQGLITLILGLGLINFPRKRQLERKLLSNQKVFRAINWLRLRRNKAALIAPE